MCWRLTLEEHLTDSSQLPSCLPPFYFGTFVAVLVSSSAALELDSRVCTAMGVHSFQSPGPQQTLRSL